VRKRREGDEEIEVEILQLPCTVKREESTYIKIMFGINFVNCTDSKYYLVQILVM
jgi:hypothetical protein